MKRGIKNIFLSLVGFSAAPMLTACYGVPPHDYLPVEGIDSVEGVVVDTNMQPLCDIRVQLNGTISHTLEDGSFCINTEFYPNQTLTATDVDGEANGGYFGTAEVAVNATNYNTVCVVMEKQ